ncbi:MAG: Rrf2 family transcriptional regulator [Paenibacillus sp.]|uniref:Rrf2 family transcriptional regulator n=1 Tax=Paenibacillus sp. TaxID=58172 RepID=UPI0028FF0C1B|nr:Rrf2 family transcriptional regulator [Paenibacillus sp.]MDU2242814.1 Rrf2 family transcriptional regulator [Paenibacillus sp.]
MINTRLAIGIHILSLVALSSDAETLNSEWIAGSIQTNPVVVRRMTSQLKKAGLLKAARGNRGLMLTGTPEDISFLQILRAVDPENTLFAVHQHANMNCVVGRHIESTLSSIYQDIQQTTENDLAKRTLKQVLDQLQR